MPYTRKNIASSGAIRTYYEVHGSGDPLVLISGLGGDATFWTDSVPVLSEQFQVVIFDNRGIGRSDAPDIPYTLEMLADDVAYLLDELGIEAAHVLGFSMGGCIAQHFALKYPHKLRKLIIAASYAKMNRQAEWFLDAVLSVYETGATAKQMYSLILPWLFSPGYLGRPESAAFLEFDENDPLQQPLYAFRRQYLAQRAFDARGGLVQIKAPTLVLAGEYDRLIPVSDARELSTGIPQSRLVVFPEAGHLFNVEAPQQFHAAVIDFLLAIP